jgi:hypothetical protein
MQTEKIIHMKARGIAVIDIDIEGYREAAEVEEKLNEIIKNLVDGDKRVVNYAVQLRERRGDQPPELSKMKFRAN